MKNSKEKKVRTKSPGSVSLDSRFEKLWSWSFLRSWNLLISRFWFRFWMRLCLYTDEVIKINIFVSQRYVHLSVLHIIAAPLNSRQRLGFIFRFKHIVKLVKWCRVVEEEIIIGIFIVVVDQVVILRIIILRLFDGNISTNSALPVMSIVDSGPVCPLQNTS